jgi:hypothetical protein
LLLQAIQKKKKTKTTIPTIVNSHREKINGLQQNSARSHSEGATPGDIKRNTIMNLQKTIGNQAVQRLMRSGELAFVETMRTPKANGLPSELTSGLPLEIAITSAEAETLQAEVLTPTALTPTATTPPTTVTTTTPPPPRPPIPITKPTDAEAHVAEKLAKAEPAAAAAPTSIEVPEPGGAPAAEPKAAAVVSEDQQAATAKGIPKIEKEEKEKAPPAKSKGEKKDAEETEAAAPPSPYRAIGPAIKAVNQRRAGLRKHSPPSVPVASAQAAALEKNTEQTRSAAIQTVKTIDRAKDQAKPVQKIDFKEKLRKAIEAATKEPKTEEDAENVMKTGAKDASDTMRDQLAWKRDAAVGPLKTVTDKQAVDAAPSDKPPPEVKLEKEPLGKPPQPVSSEPVVPAPLPAERLDYSSDREPTERAMSEAGITNRQLENGNEPEFEPALKARSEAEQHEAQVEAKYRESEASIQDDARSKAGSKLLLDLAGMHGTRKLHIGQVTTQQDDTKSKDALERQRITDEITKIKNSTKEDVEKILTSMETEAGTIFEAGLARAEKVYADTFEEAKGSRLRRAFTWGERWERLIERSLKTARSAYLNEVDITIDKVADLVDTKLEQAKQRVAQGRNEVDGFVKSLGASVLKFGEDAQKEVSKEFDEMEGEIDQRRDKLVDKLAQQYKASYGRMSAMEEKLREENKSLWQRVYDATVGLVKKILAFKDMLLSVLSKAADVISDIISDPIGFLGNLVSGVMQGLENFMSNIGIHLKKGLLSWLLGALAGAGLQLPDTFDLKGIISILLQIFGLTYANFRARAVKIVGEPTVAAIEKTAEIFRVIATEGVSGIARLIMEKLEDLKSMVLDAIFDFLKERVIMAGIKWIISLLNPASAFIKAIKAIYEIVMFFVNRASQIMEFVNAVIDSIGAIAKGNLSIAATAVENALANAVPLAIGLLAALLDIGDPSKPVRNIMEKAQAPVNKAIDWLINKAVQAVKAAGKLLGFGEKEKDIGGPKGAARRAIQERMSGEITLVEAKQIVKEIKMQLSPIGLKQLEIGPEKENGELPILAEASVMDRVETLVHHQPIVAISAKITLGGGSALSGLERKGEKLSETVPFIETFKTKEERKALGGTGKEPVRTATLPFVSQPPGTPARKGDQPSAGIIIEPKEMPGPLSELEILAWNTRAPEIGSNVSHAEHQFVEWLELRPSPWRARVLRIDIEVEGRVVCDDCAREMRHLEKWMKENAYPNVKINWTGRPEVGLGKTVFRRPKR